MSNTFRPFLLHRVGAAGLAALLITVSLPRALTAQEVRQFLPETRDFQVIAAADPATPDGKLQTIRKNLAAGEFSDAQDLAEKWIEAYPNHPRLVDAYLLCGEAKMGQGDYYQALFDYEKVLKDYPASEAFNIALERQFVIGEKYSHGLKKSLLGLRIIPADDEAVEIFLRIQERAPGSEIGERAVLALGEHYFSHQQMSEAAETFDYFLINYPRSLAREPAMKRLIDATMATFRSPRLDSTGLVEGQHRIRRYQREFPAAAEKAGAEALLVRTEESLARKLFYDASWYEQRGEKVSAIYMYRRLIHDYPRSAAAQDSIGQLTALHAPVASPQRTGRYLPASRGPTTATAPASEVPPTPEQPTTSRSQELKP